MSVDEAMKFMEYEKPNEEEGTPMDIDIDADALVWNISLYIVYPNTMHTILLKCLLQYTDWLCFILLERTAASINMQDTFITFIVAPYIS